MWWLVAPSGGVCAPAFLLGAAQVKQQKAPAGVVQSWLLFWKNRGSNGQKFIVHTYSEFLCQQMVQSIWEIVCFVKPGRSQGIGVRHRFTLPCPRRKEKTVWWGNVSMFCWAIVWKCHWEDHHFRKAMGMGCLCLLRRNHILRVKWQTLFASTFGKFGTCESHTRPLEMRTPEAPPGSSLPVRQDVGRGILGKIREDMDSQKKHPK